MSRSSLLWLLAAGLTGCVPQGTTTQPATQTRVTEAGTRSVTATVSFGPEKSGDHWTLTGTLSGDLSDTQSLWVLAEQGGAYRVVHPSIEVGSDRTSWRHRQISLPPGSWELHICLVETADAHKQPPAGEALGEIPPGFHPLATVSLHVPDTTAPPLAIEQSAPKATEEKPTSGAPVEAAPLAPPTQQLPPEPAGDRIVIIFSAPLDDIRERIPFGVFREEIPRSQKDKSPKWQWIEEADAEIVLADGTKARALRLKYDVANRGTYNGWWLDLEEADWSAYADGTLQLRVRIGTPGTSVFKIELKNDPNDPRKTLPFIVRLDERHMAEMQAQGFCDVAIPMQEIAANEDLSKMSQFVVVFENRRVDETIGDLLIRSIRLSPDDSNPER